MYFIDALQYPLKDSSWITKMIIAGVLLFIPIIGWLILGGYALRTTKGLLTNQTGLPEWDDWGGDLSRGFMAFLGGLLYNIPTILISCCTTILGNSDNFAIVALNCILSLVQLGYGFVIVPFLFSAIARFSLTEDFGSYLDFGGRFEDVTNNSGDALMLVLNYFIFGIIMAIAIMVGFVLCCIPGLIAYGVAIMGGAYLVAEWGKIIGVSNGGMANMGGAPQNVAPLS